MKAKMSTRISAAITGVVFLLGVMPLVGCASAPTGQGGFSAAPPPSARFTGDGGSGTRIAIMPLEPQGLPAGQEHLPSFVQGELLNNFRQNSDMSVLDRAGLPAILMEIESGIYSPDADFGALGEIAGVDYFLMGNIIATGTGYILQLQVTGAGRETVGLTRASFSDTVTRAELDNLTSVRRASADMLRQMGVTLTSIALQDLTYAPTENEIRAENYLARSIVAQNRGNEIEAMLLSAQARVFNPQLIEAADRQSILAAHIQTGGLGTGVVGEIAWRAAWVERLREAEQFFADVHRAEIMPYTLFYTTEIQQGAIDWATETVSLSITTHLHGSDMWASSMEEVLGTVGEGLRATGRAQAWGFDGWPFRGTITGINIGARRTNNFTVVFELLNAHGEVIGRQSLQSSGNWQLTQQGIHVQASDRRTLTFQNVNAHAITDDGMTVRVVSVNGVGAEAAARDGVLQIRAITQSELARNDQFRFARGTIHGFSNNDARTTNVPNMVIPAAVWGYPVVAIGQGAFDARQWGAQRMTSLTIPDSVTRIEADAFRANHLTRVTIPSSVTYIGERAFWDERRFAQFRPDAQTFYSPVTDEIHITMGANVTLSGNPFRFGQNERWLVQVNRGGVSFTEWREEFRGFDGFAANYIEGGRQAGTYSFIHAPMVRGAVGGWVGGIGADIAELRQQQQQQVRRGSIRGAILLIALLGVVVVGSVAF